jgi:membrane dipeptidase
MLLEVNMNYIDFHIDTLMRWVNDKAVSELPLDVDLWENNYHVDIERLIKSNYSAQLFACFICLGDEPIFKISHYDDALKSIELFHEQIGKKPEKIAFARSYQDYLTNKSNNKLSAFLTVEEGGIIDGKIERLDELYNKGVRAITLTWNYENCIGYPNVDFAYKDNGLKPFGIEVVEKMDDLGIIIDVSHLSDAGFYDVHKHSKMPFLATHSNSRVLRNHSRNLTDEMVKMLANKGGMTGINFAGGFLQDDGISTVDSMVAHIKHLINVGGLEVVGLGTDLDGIGGELEINSAANIHILSERMEKNGLTTEQIEAVCYKNAEDFFKRYWS